MTRERYPVGRATVLTPVLPHAQGELERCLASLPSDAASPFGQVVGTHFARFVLISTLPTNRPNGSTFTLGMTYLLFTSTFDGPVERYFDKLSQNADGYPAQVWGCCVGYPVGQPPAAVREYLEHNSLKWHMQYSSEVATVPEVLAALELREWHAELARKALLDDPMTWRSLFLAAHGTSR